MKPYNIPLILLMFIASACKNASQTEAQHADEEHEHSEQIELTAEQLKTVRITLGKVSEKALNSVVRTNGMLQLNPQDRAEVNSLINGIVCKICVTEGQHVKAGQVVAYVENTEIVSLQRDYLIANRELTLSLQELKRQETLAEAKAGIEKTLQQAHAAYETARVKQMGLRQQLQQLGINASQVANGKMQKQVAVVAPISGIVTKINVSSGAYTEGATPLLQIANNAAVYCQLNVFERNIAQVAKGQEVDFVATSAPSVHYKGTVVSINRSINPTTQTIAVHVKINAPTSSHLIPETYVTALINTGRQRVKAMPDEAIVSMEGKKYAFLLEKQSKEKGVDTYHFKRVEISTGVSELGYTQVDFVTPLPHDATIVTAGAFYLASMSADHGEH